MRKIVLVFTIVIMTVTMSGCCFHHEWSEATCTSARVCLKCGKIEGDPLGHTWISATCTEPMICSVCGETQGNPLGHTYDIDGDDFTCTRCNEENLFTYNDMDDVFYEISEDYSGFSNKYLEKTLLMQIKVNGGIQQGEIIDNGFGGTLRNITAPEAGLPDIAVYITYSPQEPDSFNGVEEFDYLIVRAKLDRVYKGWFDSQYFIEFSDTEIVNNSWD